MSHEDRIRKYANLISINRRKVGHTARGVFCQNLESSIPYLASEAIHIITASLCYPNRESILIDMMQLASPKSVFEIISIAIFAVSVFVRMYCKSKLVSINMVI